MKFESVLEDLTTRGNLRQIPADSTDRADLLDFSTNDYLGLAADQMLRREFVNKALQDDSMVMSSSASRLLAATQRHHEALEDCFARMYGGGRKALLFNSGYHANTGILPAISDKSTLIIADKLVHASLIDGMILSRCDFRRFPHNDIEALERLVRANADRYETIVVAAESVYSMDGDRAPLEEIAELKMKYNNMLLYLDEAHAFGIDGPDGLGLAQGSRYPELWDIVIGTFGKAAASSGAFAIVAPKVRELLVNRSRSLIFSTALPPIQMAWTQKIVELLPYLEPKREHVRVLAKKLSDTLSLFTNSHVNASHIQPLIVGDAKRAVELSKALLEKNVKVLAIRTPTVPAGTERLRFSLSAAMTDNDIDRLRNALESVI